MRRTSTLILQIFVLTAVTAAFQNCSPAYHRPTYELSSPSEGPLTPLVLQRTNVPAASNGAILVSGRCISNREVSIRVQSDPAVAQACPTGEFQRSVALTGADELKTITVSQTDASGRVWMDSISVTKDTLAPPVAIASVTKQGTNVVIAGSCESNSSINVNFGGSILSASNRNCVANVFSLTAQLSAGDGIKRLLVSQTDEAGNLGSAEVDFLLDSASPVVTIAAPVQGEQFSDAFTVSGTCETGIDVSVSGGGVASLVAGPCTAGRYSIAANLSMGLGSKIVEAVQTDASQNTGRASVTVTRIAPAVPAPVIAIAQPAANSIHINGLTLSGTCQAGLTVNISGAVSAPSTATCASGTFSAPVSFSNGQGNKTLTVSQTNLSGQTGSSSRNFIRDSVAPVISITSPAAGMAVGASVMISGTCESGLSVAIGGAGAAAPVNAACAGGIFSGSVNLSATDGPKQITAGQTDTAGNSASAAVSLTKDTAAPVLQITGPAANTMAESGLSVTGTCENNLNVTAAGAGLASSAQVLCANQAFSLPVIFSAGDGSKTVTMTQTDGAGNSTSVSRTFVKGTVTLDGRALYAQHCAGCHGAIDSSPKRGRTAAQITAAISGTPAMSALPALTALSQSQIAAIAAALALPAAPANAFACDANEAPERLDARRFSKVYLYNTLNGILTRAYGAAEAASILASAPVSFNSKVPQDTVAPFSKSDTNFDLAHATAYFEVAHELATLISGSTRITQFVNTYINYNRGACTLTTVDTMSAACRDVLIRNFILRAWGRPVEENNTNLNYEITGFQSEFQSGNAAGVGALVFKALTAAPFLMQVNSDITQVSGTSYRLSSYAIARRLAFDFMQSAPDEGLLAIAQSQDLTVDPGFTNALNYVSAPARAVPQLREFTAEWLKLSQIPIFVNQSHPKFQRIAQGITVDNNLRTAIIDEVLELSSYLYSASRPVTELLTSNVSFARQAGLMRIYGQTTAAPQTVTEANAVRFPAGERSGLITRSAYLVAGDHTERPVMRGLHVRRDLLCLDLAGAPPPDAFNTPLPTGTDMTTREKYHAITSGGSCVGCHAQINPPGFALSRYNALGGHQTMEPIFDANGQFVRELPVDAAITTSAFMSESRSINGAVEFSDYISRSQEFKRCLTQHYYSYLRGLTQRTQSQNSCAMNRMYQAIDSGGSMTDFVRAPALDARFKLRQLVK